MPKFKTQYNGTEIEVEIDGVVPVSEIGTSYVPKVAHDQEVGKWKRLASKVKNDDDLLGDPDFKSRAFSAWGINPDGKGQASPEQVASIQEAVRTKELSPLQDELKRERERTAGLLRQGLNMELIDAARSIGRDSAVVRIATSSWSRNLPRHLPLRGRPAAGPRSTAATPEPRTCFAQPLRRRGS